MMVMAITITIITNKDTNWRNKRASLMTYACHSFVLEMWLTQRPHLCTSSPRALAEMVTVPVAVHQLP